MKNLAIALVLASSSVMAAHKVARAAEISCDAYNAGSSSEFGLSNNNRLGTLTLQVEGLDWGSVQPGSTYQATATGTGYLDNAAGLLNEALQTAPVTVNEAGDLVFGTFDDIGMGLILRKNPVSSRGVTYPAYTKGSLQYNDGSAILSGYVQGCTFD